MSTPFDPNNPGQGQWPPQPPQGYQQGPPHGWGQQPQRPPTRQEARAAAKGQKAQAKAMRPWYKKKRSWLGALLALIVIIAVSSSLKGGSDPGSTTAAPAETTAPATAPAARAPETKAPANRATETKAPATKNALTSEQANAAQAAKTYLDTIPFSRKGLIQQWDKG